MNSKEYKFTDGRTAVFDYDENGIGKITLECMDALMGMITQQWVPITSRPMDEEEREEWSDRLGYELDDEEAVIYSSLPDDGQEVLTCSKYGHITKDTFYQDECGCYFEDNGEMDGIIAWMPLPLPYKGDKS